MADVSVKIKKVPSDAETYIGVEYIESTGTQYLQLGVDTDYNTTDLYIDYQYTSVTGGSEYSQGAVYSLSAYRSYSDMLWSAFTSSGYGLYSYSYGSSNTNRLSENATLSKCILERNSTGVFFNGVKQDVPTYTPKGNSTSKITLFALNYGDNESVMMKSKMRLYGFRLGNSQGDKYNLVPCVRKVDNVAGMYDTINKKFYTNNGTGEFVVGATNGEMFYDDILVIDKNNGLKSVESLSQSTGQPKEIFYGVVPSTSSLQIVDINGDIAKMVESGEIPNSNVKVDVVVNGKQVQSHISTNSEYNINTKIFSTEMSDILSKWENIVVLNNKGYSEYLYKILQKILMVADYSVEEIDEMCDTQIVYGNNNLIGSVKDYLNTILVRNNYNDTLNLKQAVENVCTIAQLNVFQRDDGKIKFVSSRPRIVGNEPILSIPKKQQLSTPQIDFIVKNKYNSIKYNHVELIENVKEVFSLRATIEDKDGNLDLESIGANVKIITEDDGTSYLCFIKEVTNYSSMFTFQNVYSDHNVHPVQITTQNYEETISSISKSVGFNYSQSTIDEYDFSSYAPATILSNYSGTNSETIAFKIELNNEHKSKISIKLFARVFNRKETTLQSGDGTNQYEYNFSNSWLKSNTHFIDWDAEPSNRNINIYNIITNNIIKDYSDGIKTATLTICCADYYDTNGEKAKDWNNGEILQVGDIVRVDKDNNGNSAMKRADGSDMYFKVTGRRFRKVGVPLVDLELQEVKVID